MIIKSIKKVKSIYEVIYDTQVIKYHEEVIIKYKLLKSNIDISNEEYENTLLDNRYFFIRDKALKYLKNMKFKKQVIDHLLKVEEIEIINKVIDYLEKNKIIDDYKTCICYSRFKYQSGYGNNYIKNKLKEMKVDNKIVNEVLEELKNEEYESLYIYFNKLLKTIKALNHNDLLRILNLKLINHGYNTSDIKNIIVNNIELINKHKYNKDSLNIYYKKALTKYDNINENYKQENKIINYLLRKGFTISEIKEKVNI